LEVSVTYEQPEDDILYRTAFIGAALNNSLQLIVITTLLVKLPERTAFEKGVISCCKAKALPAKVTIAYKRE
jgi:hypothetical protein